MTTPQAEPPASSGVPRVPGLPAHGERHRSASSQATSATRQRILDAAREILTEGGVPALTVEAITARAGVNRAAVSYHFGGKAALVALVVDTTVQEMMLEVLRSTEQLPLGESRVACHIAGEQRITENDDAYRAWFGVFPLAFSDAAVREQIAAAYEWYVAVNRRCLGEVEGASEQQMDGLARLIAAVTDGLAAQRSMSGGSLDVSEPFRLFTRMVALLEKDLRQAADGAAGTPA